MFPRLCVLTKTFSTYVSQWQKLYKVAAPVDRESRSHGKARAPNVSSWSFSYTWWCLWGSYLYGGLLWPCPYTSQQAHPHWTHFKCALDNLQFWEDTNAQYIIHIVSTCCRLKAHKLSSVPNEKDLPVVFHVQLLCVHISHGHAPQGIFLWSEITVAWNSRLPDILSFSGRGCYVKVRSM